MIIKWLASKLFPLLQLDEGMLNIHKRLDRIEKNSHPPIFTKDQVNRINKRLEDLEMKAFVDKTQKYDWQGSD